MSNDARAYDLAVVRDLLLAAFTADDLRRMILYTSRPALKPLIHQLSSGDGLAAMVEKTSTFCHKQGCMTDLIAEVKEANPRQYAHFVGRLRTSEAEPDPSTPTVSGGTTYSIHIERAHGIAIGDGAQVISGITDPPGGSVDS